MAQSTFIMSVCPSIPPSVCLSVSHLRSAGSALRASIKKQLPFNLLCASSIFEDKFPRHMPVTIIFEQKQIERNYMLEIILLFNWIYAVISFF